MSLMSLKMPSIIDFNQPTQCRALLARINVTDLEEAAQTLHRLLEGMAVASPPPAMHLQILEEARPTLDYVQGEIARRYASRPLPPSSSEEATLQQVVRLWSLMASNYAFVAQRSILGTDGNFEGQRALLMHRRISYQALAMNEFFRARQEIPAHFWLDLHALFVSAERAGLAQVRVPDALNETWGAQSPQEAYVAFLLVDTSSPYSRTPREFQWTTRWAQRFAPYCSLHDEVEDARTNSYVLDLMADHGLRPSSAMKHQAGQRRLNTTKLAAHIQSVAGRLKSGVAPASLGLGEDCVQPACARLIVSLYRPWGLAASGRKFPRKPSQGEVQICSDPAGVAFFLTGTPFECPEKERVRYSDFARAEAMLALGERIEQVELNDEQRTQKALELGYALEAWDVLDQSLAGFRLVRAEGESRLDHRQLIGVRASSQERMLLAEISWLQYRRSGALSCGISLMPGPPVPFAVCRIAPLRPTPHANYQLGFLIPGVSALNIDHTLIVPAGWYVSDQRVEVRSEQPWFARMTKLLSRGANFDRVVFTRESAAV
jgi:hypothetical protein